MGRSSTKRTKLSSYLEERRPALITPETLEEIRARLAPVSRSYLRGLVRRCGVPLHPLVEGVVQDDFISLGRTLTALSQCYESGDAAEAREAVLAAKEHAGFALRRLEGAPAEQKREMILWMLTWLENPSVFPGWLRLRRPAIESRSTGL